MTYLITEIWFFLLCACLIGLLLGWGIWGWTSRRLIMDAKARRDSERLSLKRNFEAEKIALEEDKAAAFMARDEALNGKAAMISELETARKSSADADRLRRALDDARQRQSGLEADVTRLRTLLTQREAPTATDTQSQEFTTDAPRPISLFDRRPDVVDDLKEVKGIGPVMERILNENGCYHFRQLANFSKRDIEWISAALESFPDRIERDDWVRQAQALYLKKYGRRHDADAIRTLETMS